MEPLSLLTLAILFAAGCLAGFIDSIAGGGGIITVPALLAVGVPPHQALATNKLQSSCGSLTAALNYARLGLMEPRRLAVGFACTLAGGVAGAVAVQHCSAGFLENLIILLLAALFVYTLFSPQLGFTRRPHRMNRTVFYTLAGLGIGFYDGFFGPGTGSFWTIALVLLLGLDLKQATARTKLFNMTSNLAALAMFLHAGLVLWGAGLAMGIGQVLGAFCGSTLVSRHEMRFIRHFFLVVVAATILKLLYSRFC